MLKRWNRPWRLLIGVFVAAIASANIVDAQATGDWTEPFPPFRIAGNLYYVGSKGLASYLIATSQGHILINSDLEENVPLIRASVEKLGFKFTDVEILLISHAHWDHDAASDDHQDADRREILCDGRRRIGRRVRRQNGLSVRRRGLIALSADEGGSGAA